MQDKVVLVTGGARRVGAAICRRLHAAGARLVLHYRSAQEDARALQAQLNARRADSVLLVQADLLQLSALPALVQDALEQYGRLDAVVNNASSFFPTALGEIDGRAWDDLVGTNLKAPLFLAQAATPHLRKQSGCIVNIVDIHADYPLKNYLVYNTAKGGLFALTKSLAQELAPEVRVNGIAPGPILWPDDSAWSDELARQRIVNQTLLKRVGEPDDIAKAVEFFIADAPYVTGQVLAVDGGRSVKI
ncbi:MAG: pteridine reductase [Pseudomonadota bacterium]